MKYRFVRCRFVRYWFRCASRPWLDTDIPSKHSVCLQDVLKTSSAWQLEEVLEDEKLLHWRCIEDVFKTSWGLTNVCWERCRTYFCCKNYFLALNMFLFCTYRNLHESQIFLKLRKSKLRQIFTQKAHTACKLVTHFFLLNVARTCS